MPVAAAIGAGSVRVLSGSRIARRGNSGKSAISSLTLRSGSLITAAIDTSLPVPAVVGMQASGAMSSGLPMPSSSRGIRKKPSCSAAPPPWVKTASATFAVSITDPPPTARNESAPASLAAAAQRSHTSRRRVLRDLVEHTRDLEPAVGDARLDPLDQPGAADHLVGDDEDPARALLLELEPGGAEQVAASDDPGRGGVLVEVLEAPQRGGVERGAGLHQAASSRSCRPCSSSCAR